MISIKLKDHQVTAYHKVRKEKEKSNTEHALKGWRERRTYGDGLGFGPYIAVPFQEITDYPDLDAFRNQDDPVFRKWMEEVTGV